MTVNLWGAEITFRVSSAAPDAEPVWVDLSDRVIVPAGQTLESWLGRSTELSGGEPGKFRLTLLNNDDALTTGNPSSPYPWWKQSRRAQVLETVYGKEFVLADVYLEIPQQTIAMQPTDGDVKLITVNVTGIDIVARLRNGRKLKAALTEHILFHGGTDLVGFWPMTQAGEPFTGVGPTTAALNMSRTATGTVPPLANVQPQTGSAPAAAEASAARMNTYANVNGRAFVQTKFPSSFTPAVGANDAIIFVWWFAFTAAMADNTSLSHDVALLRSPSIANVRVGRDTTSGSVTLDASGTLTGTTAGAQIGFEALLPLGVYVHEASATMEFWVGSQRLPAALTGSPVGGATLNLASYYFGYQIDYDMSNLQVYVGQNWGYTQYLAQIQQGHAPLDRQLTGARVNTILDYLRFPGSRRDIDPGVAVMSQATLAGKTGGQLIDEATATERGRFFAVGGRTQFHDRVRVYNV